ncbi:MAG: T9SS type A sorting domain-containing protein [Bacteroidetes bacterium]|nr:T9SS type A sorting domain-containing protein [Bacteroidota bacterium]
MKKYTFKCYLILIGWLITAWNINAQPILTGASHPNIGESYHYIGISLSPSFVLGNAGPSMTWDYTTMPQNQNLAPSYKTDSFVDPSVSACKSSFASSNLANIQTSISGLSGGGFFYDTTYCYYKVSSNAYIDLGQCDAKLKPTVNPFDKPHLIYPFTYLSKFDTTLQFISGADTSYIILGMEADAYGTLKLPNAAYQDVLRIVEKVGFSWQTGGFYSKKYSFYNSTTHDVLMSVTYTTDSSYNPDTVYSPSLEYLVQVSTNNAIATIDNPYSFIIIPNPTQGIIHIKNGEEASVLKVIDITGKQMHKQHVSSVNKEIDLSFLPSGIYIVQLDQNGFTYTQKVIVE